MQNWNLQSSLSPYRSAFIAMTRAINTTLDQAFYDITALSEAEQQLLSLRLTPEGYILLVYPSNQNKPITSYQALEYINWQNGEGSEAIDSVVVAGVGSSALGTAALARNVADHINRPVAGIVAGYGIADVISEGVGGWFVLGAANRIRRQYAKVFDALELRDHVWDDLSYSDLVRSNDLSDIDLNNFIFGSYDSLSLLLLLHHLRGKIKLLVGHSKGNYSIENALEGLIDISDKKQLPLPENLQIVTLGAAIHFPKEFTNVHQFIGALDGFGALNSQEVVDRESINGLWHTLNSNIPGHLSVEKALDMAGVRS